MSKIRPAAGIILYRGEQVFLARRGGAARFLPGFFVFPGGAGEKSDTSLEHTARREFEEETGVDLSDVPLRPSGVFLTPEYSALIRFQAQFFLAECPDGVEPVVDDEELVEGLWCEPDQALELWQQGKFPLAPPTLGTLRALAAHPFEEAADWLQAQPVGNGVEGPEIPMAEGLAYLPLPTPTLPPARHTLTYLVGGDRVLVVDPGAADVSLIQQVLERYQSLGRQPLEVVLTHHHPDHIGGAQALGLPIAAHPATAAHLPFAVDRSIDEGDTWQLGRDPAGQEWCLTALHTPGHASGHICLWDPQRKFLLAGDTISSISTILVNPPDGSMRDYFATLKRLEELDPQLVFPAHGPPLGPGSQPFTLLLRHRLQREEKVLQALESNPISLEAILEQAYDDVPTEVWPLARLSLTAHLEKLVLEGRAQKTDGGWSAA